MGIDMQSFLLGRASRGGDGGGGNPNWIETIEGTLANPWGSLSYMDVYNGLKQNAYTVFIEIPSIPETVLGYANSYGYCGAPISLSASENEEESIVAGITGFGGIAPDRTEGIFRFSWVFYSDDPSEPYFEFSTIRTDSTNHVKVTDVSENTPCTLTIIHHPMPESGTEP